MRNHGAGLLRNHWHILLVVPLVVIAITWPTFPRIFDSQDYWFHTGHGDTWLRIWDAWHLERVLTGRAELFYTESIFHPRGLSLAFVHYSLPHALMLIVFEKLMPADNAYNLLFLLILCFNAYCTYPLILYLIGEKWIALFGAIVVGVSVPFLGGSTIPDLIMIGTIPLTIYFFLRHVAESRWIFAALAGISAGATAFISVYIFVFILMTIGIIAIFLAILHWKQPAFWRGLLLFMVVCGAISSLRFYPMFVDITVLQEGLETHLGRVRSNDVLECCVLTGNPFTGELFRKVFAFLPDTEQISPRQVTNHAYLGYINLFFLLCALLHKPLRRRLAPWLAVLVVFAILRLGHFLTINGQEYRSILLPEHYLSEWFPALFGSVYIQEYYQYGVVVPLAILASFGLERLIRSKPALVRASVILLSVLILVIEFYNPLTGYIIEREKIAYIDWFSTESDSSIKLINLPQGSWKSRYYLAMQSLNNYPTAFGLSNRLPASSRTYIRSNAILQLWDDNRSVHCLPHRERAYMSALGQLLADGFTHVIVHNWIYGDQFINHSFWNVPASYTNGFVSAYRLRDLRLSCESKQIELPRFSQFAESPSAIPGLRSSIISFHPTDSIDADLFAYLDSLFSDWQSLLHLYLDDSELVMQSAGKNYPDMESFARDNQVIYLLYNSRDTDSAAPRSQASLEQFDLCQREEHDDGSIIEHYVKREFSCALVTASQPLQVDYDNGIRLENVYLEHTHDDLDVELMWSNLASEPHSVSLQIFGAADDKVLGQDSTVGHVSLRRHRVNISSLPPGGYVVKLIVYNFNTGHSVSGKVSETSVRFDRELEIATIDRF